MTQNRAKTYQVSPKDYPNCNQSFHRHQVIQRWKSLDPTPQLTIEPARHWPGRWVVVISQKRTRWELVPCLTHSEALDLESLIKGREICLELDLNHGTPFAGEQIYSLAEAYLAYPQAFTPVRRQVEEAIEPVAEVG